MSMPAASAILAQTTSPATAPADEMVSLNLPENAPLKVLLEYVSQEFGYNILYDEQVATQRLTIKTPASLPKSAVLPLLESALKMRGLALIDADQPGWKRVVAMQQAARVPIAGNSPAVVMQVFKLKYADAAKLDPLIKPFLTQPGASSFPLQDQQLLVVTDYATNLKRITELVDSIDQPNQDVGIEFFEVHHADPARLVQQLDQLLKAKLHSEGGDDRLANTLETSYDVRTNQVVVVAARSRMADAREIVKSLDSAIAQEQSPIRFYKLANATAADVLTTIRGLEGDSDNSNPPPSSNQPNQLRTPDATGTSPLNTSQSSAPSPGSPGDHSLLNPSLSDRGSNGITSGNAAAQLPPALGSAGAADSATATSNTVKTKHGTITADPNTNSIIVIAPPDVQVMYEQLIRTLDKRRPQVLIECTIVTLDTTGNFQFGVEIGHEGGFNRNKTVTFSSFGLSTPDPGTGALSIVPGLGFNGALISSDIADVIVRALQQNTRARVTAAPRILVNDNSLGTLSSLNEFPYSSINASQTVATTSFGSYAQAGTEITITPHISESDYLQLEFSVLQSSFSGAPTTEGGTTLPPPRKSDSVQSRVTIPDGSTIVVGGLNSHNINKSVDAIPILGQIPFLRFLFSNNTDMDSTSTLFVFIRPVILRDDQFADLKFLSEKDLRAAQLPMDFPSSDPLTIR